jgi:PKHD-type hydroxylase
MLFHIAEVIGAAETAALREVMSEVPLRDGRETAGWHARERKSNLQADPDIPLVTGALRKIETAFLGNEVFQAAARPKRIVGLLLSRYEPGTAYGTHIDDALIHDQRTDLAFTLFLSEPDSYDGGELVIERTEDERGFKLPAGHLLLYPATTLHRVAPVTRGVRLAAVGWVRSLVRDDAQRELLFDLDEVIELLRSNRDPERVLNLILKTRGNLLRRWLED